MMQHLSSTPRHLSSSRFFSSIARYPSLLSRISQHDPKSFAVTCGSATHTYASLLSAASVIGSHIQSHVQLRSTDNFPRLGLLLPADFSYIRTLLGIWSANCVAVPLSPKYPVEALRPLVKDAGISSIYSDDTHTQTFEEVETFTERDISGPEDQCSPTHIDDVKRMILYTSGTTGAPKGVVWTDRMLSYQLSTLSRAWMWSAQDRILNVLPLHHVHGIVNVVLSALYNGAHVHMHPRFDPGLVWAEFCSERPLSVFMAVPTVYSRLIDFFLTSDPASRRQMRAAVAKVRLFVCGSAALSEQLSDAWLNISGQRVLERYGMTEMGMALSNEYNYRVPGTLGAPLPGVSAKILNEEVVDGTLQGELCVKSPGVFQEYWGMAEATKKAFVNGWFATGDIVSFDEDSGYYKMVGRASSDIIKTGGYKVSALEIEAACRQMSSVKDICVVGYPDCELGERIIAQVVPLQEGKDRVTEHILADQVLTFARDRLPLYKVPREVHIVPGFPRNALGKVQKKEIVAAIRVKKKQQVESLTAG